MHQTGRNILFGFLIVVGGSGQLRAIERIRVLVEPAWDSRDDPTTDKTFDAAVSDLEHGSFDPAATDLAKAIDKWTVSIFNLPSLTRKRAVTYRDSAGDNLLMEWDFQEQFATGTAILRDTPDYSTFSMRLTLGSWRSREELGNLLTDLIRWEAAPIVISGLPVSVGPDYTKTSAFFGMPPLLFLRQAFIRDFMVLGRESQGQMFLQVNVGKSYSDGLDGVPAFVPERFPPLAVLAHSWDERTILHEIGKPADQSAVGNPSEKRDLILITELARRGLSEANFIKLLATVPPKHLESRAFTLFSAMHAARKDSDFDRYFQSMVAEYQRIGPSADGAIRTAFKIIKGRKACAPEFEQSALRLLQAGTVADSALYYLEDCSNSEEVTHVLESISVPEKFAHLKESVRAEIQNRIERR